MSLKNSVALCMLLIVTANAFGAILQEKGMARVVYNSRHVKSRIRDEAFRKAELNALDRYIATSGAAEERSYVLVRSTMAKHLSHYILSTSTIAAFSNMKTKEYTLVISVDLNTDRINNTLQANSAVANTSLNQRSYITFIFVARQENSVTEFGKKTTVRLSSRNELNGSSHMSMKGRAHGFVSTNQHLNGMDAAADTQNQQAFASSHHRDLGIQSSAASRIQGKYGTVNHSVTQVTKTSSMTRRANITRYRVRRSGTIDDVISHILTQAGYQVVDAPFIAAKTHNLLNVASFKKEFGEGDDISQRTLANAATAAQKVHVPYLAYGTLDVGIQNTDPVTGLKRVYVEVTAKVYNLGGVFPVTIAAVGPVQYAGLGPSFPVARTNALKVAARKAAQKLVAEMNAAGIH